MCFGGLNISANFYFFLEMMKIQSKEWDEKFEDSFPRRSCLENKGKCVM